MRLWRNRQTRTFEGRVVNTVRVQVSSVAPESLNPSGFSAFYISRACSSTGRALRSQRRGREFESLQVHQMKTPLIFKPSQVFRDVLNGELGRYVPGRRFAFRVLLFRQSVVWGASPVLRQAYRFVRAVGTHSG